MKKDPMCLPLLSTCWGLAGEKLLFPGRMLTWVDVVSEKFAVWLLPQRPRPLPWWKMSWPEAPSWKRTLGTPSGSNWEKPDLTRCTSGTNWRQGNMARALEPVCPFLTPI